MKKRYYISFALVLLVTMLILGTTYAYYKTKINGNSKDKSISVLSKYLAVKYSDGTSTMNFDGDYFFPGDSAEKTFSVENTGNDKTTYSIKIDNVINEFERIQDIRYKLYINEEEVSSGAINNSETQYLYYEREIEKGSKDNIKLVVSYSETEESQNVDMNKTLSFRVNIDNKKENKTSGSSVTFLGNGNTLENYRIYGNSVQNATPSPDSPVEIESVGDRTVNLIDYHNLSSTINKGITYTNNNDGSFTANGTLINTLSAYNFEVPSLEKGVTYYTSCGQDLDEKNRRYYLFLIIKNTSTNTVRYHASNAVNKTFILAENEEVTGLQIRINDATASSITVDNVIFKPIICKNEEYKEYEPYGYKIPIKTSGKNLFDKSDLISIYINATTGDITSIANSSGNANFISVIPGETYVWSGFAGNTRTHYYDKNYTWLSSNVQASGGTFTVPENAYYIKFCKGTPVSELQNYDIQLERGTTTTIYEKYKIPMTTNIYLDEPLRKIGDYADYIDFKEQKVVRNIKEKVFDGTERWELGGRGTNEVNQRFFLSDSLILSNGRLLSNILKEKYPGKASIFTQDVEGCNVSNGKYYQIKINKAYLKDLNYDVSVDGFKEYLSNLKNDNKPVRVYTTLESKIEGTMKLPNINTINGTNIITIDTDVNPTIEVNN